MERSNPEENWIFQVHFSGLRQFLLRKDQNCGHESLWSCMCIFAHRSKKSGVRVLQVCPLKIFSNSNTMRNFVLKYNVLLFFLHIKKILGETNRRGRDGEK